MKIKNYVLVVLVVGLTGIQAAAQRVTSKPAQRLSAHGTTAPKQNLPSAEIDSALDTSIETTCAQTAPPAPRALSHDPQVFTATRLANTINGVWLGKVSGEYDSQLLAADGFLNVDYYMVIDAVRGQSFVYQEFTDRRSGAGFTATPGAPKWSYVWCARQDYETKSPRQVHTFTKVSNNVNDARPILTNSVGITFAPNENVVLADVWQQLVQQQFFDDPSRSLAYAGVLFKPITMGTVQSSGGGNRMELRMVGEYRGSGETAAKFIPGEPIHNVEAGHFLGLTKSSGPAAPSSRSKASSGASGNAAVVGESGGGDYLVAALQFLNEMIGPKADAIAEVLSTHMAFDKVVIGPLSPNPGAIEITPAAQEAKAGPSGNKARAGNKQRKAHP